MTIMDIKAVQEYLPHRFPFLLVDRVTELTLGESIRGIKNVTVNEPFFQGHFPHHPIMPGVLIVEAMAQIAGILAFKTKNKTPVGDGYLYYLAGTDKTRFKKPVGPGDQLILVANVINERAQMMKFECTAHVDDQLVCSTDLMVAGVSV